MLKALIVFAVTYVFIAARRLPLLRIGRPAVALAGAVAMVTLGVLTPPEAFGFVDLRTLALLFGMMVISGYLDEAGFFAALTRTTLRRTRSPEVLLGGVVWISGLASALLVNDTVCVMMTPVVVSMTEALGVEPLPYLLALATSSNIGSVATLTGNPQNMLIGGMSGIPYRRYLAAMLPLALLGLAVNHALLLLVYRRRLRPAGAGAGAPPERVTRRGLLARSLVALAGVVLAWLLGVDLAFGAVAGAAFLIVSTRVSPQRVFKKLDWTILVFFAALFVVIGGVEKAGLVSALQAMMPSAGGAAGAAAFSAFSVVGSNLFSNVPFVLVIGKWVSGLKQPELAWYLLAMSSTFAGNLTLVGSMANLIVAELSKDVRPIGFREYFRYGLAVTAATVALGTAYLVALFG